MVNDVVGKETLNRDLICGAFDAQYQVCSVPADVQISSTDACLEFQDISGGSLVCF